MSKAILVMDMPKFCYQCPCFSISECRAYKCGTKIEDDRKKPEWCPLREVPHKITSWKGKSTNYQQGHRDGYNACIDEIMKGAEENG